MNPGLLAFSVLDARIATQCRLLSLRQLGQWVPPISGVVLVTTGALTLVANWR